MSCVCQLLNKRIYDDDDDDDVRLSVRLSAENLENYRSEIDVTW